MNPLPLKLPVKKIFEKFFISSKEPLSNFRGTLGRESFLPTASFYSPNRGKHPLGFYNPKDDATVKIHFVLILVLLELLKRFACKLQGWEREATVAA